jgi:hypothetical protein
MVPVNSTLGTAATQLLPLAVKDLDENKVTPGLLGFVIFACIGLALWWLMKNMNKQFKKIDFEQPADPSGPGEPTGSGQPAGSGEPEASASQIPAEAGVAEREK